MIVNNLFDDLKKPGRLKWVWWRVCRYTSEVRYFFRKIWQRIRYGFPLEQCWDFCSWHSSVAVPRLKHLRDEPYGHPYGLTLEEWKFILDQIIWSFENSEVEPDPIYSEDYNRQYEVTKGNGMTTYTPINCTGTVDYSPLEKHREKVQEGLNLFAKYYLHLWS